MRLGLLGPALGHADALERAARFLRRKQDAERVVYLGADQSLDQLVQRWAEQLVGEDASEAALCRRATERTAHASAEEIDEYLAREAERSRLRMYESLPGEATRAVELLAGKVALMIYDKAYLEEEDILPATLLLFGKSDEAMVKRIGRRWFLSPGSFPRGGVMLLEDQEGAIDVTIYSGSLQELSHDRLELAREVNLRVAGG
jgi:hypothetical protein